MYSCICEYNKLVCFCQVFLLPVVQSYSSVSEVLTIKSIIYKIFYSGQVLMLQVFT